LAQRAEATSVNVTHGKCLVVVGQRKAPAIVIKGARTRNRFSKLREWLIT
jgi:hypothetical protein